MALDIEIRLWRRGGEQIIRCKTQNICMTGAYIRTRELGFPRHRLLEVRLPVLDRLKLKHPRIMAKVVHQGKDGVGIRFSKADSQTIRALHKMLQWRTYHPLHEPGTG
jgi:hypothetical protein